MTSSELVCWKCGAALKGEPLPLARSAACKACHADLRVCRMCEFHEPRWRRGCREERAEEVNDHGRANFCEFFRVRPGAFAPDALGSAQGAADQDARAQLDALFGIDSTEAEDLSNEKGRGDRAREDLERLFGLDKE